MKLLSSKSLILFLVIFIGFHIFLGEMGLFNKSNSDIFPLGMNPSITHDSLSTRNPAIEDPLAIFFDLPGGYSFYLSPILVTVPILTNNLINGFPIAKLTGVLNPANTSLTQLETNWFLFLGVSGVLILVSTVWFLHHQYNKGKKDRQ